ncbi:hypothetical protein [Sphingomonas citri]|nr:hypothetical protein [Sphingomonas citri]
MAKLRDWVRKEATGRLIFRRVYPETLRPFLAKPGQRELKVSLGAKDVLSVEAYRVYDAAKRRYDLDVRQARALQSVEHGGVRERTVHRRRSSFEARTPTRRLYAQRSRRQTQG